MTRGTGARSCLAAMALVGVLGAAGLVAAPAGASSAGAASNGSTGASSVLIVHTDATGRALRATIAEARRAGAGLRHTFVRPRSFSVAVPASREAADAARLRRLPGVTSIERPVTRHLFDAAPDDPDDPGFADQQGYLDAVEAPQAWAQQHGSSAVRIAVLDTGVDVTHPDLVGKIAGTYNADTGGTAVPDTNGHGTFVAGVAAASTDNALGIAGAGWNTSILAVKIATPGGALPIDDEIAGIRWAVAHGANVINLSLGGPVPSASERAAVEYAIGKGVLVVAAAGNTGTSTKQYPAAYPGVIAVGATDPARGTAADFTTRGNWVTLAAPGVDIYSTTPQTGSAEFESTTGYEYGDGTSFAAPLVAGEAALLEAQNPSLDEQAVRADLVASAHGYQGLGLGAGQVDFARALGLVAPSTRPSTVAPTGTSGAIPVSAASSAPEVAFQVDADTPGTPVPVVDGIASTDLDSYGLANGTHTVHAYDCSSGGVCATTSTDTVFTVANSAPTITDPADGSNTTGVFSVDASHSGGGARLYVDGQPGAFAATSPYRFDVDGSALTDGQHTLTVALCNADGTQCAGPSSAALSVTSTSLHPTITTLTPATISPNGDGVDDRATLTFSLPDTENVAVQVSDASGATVSTAQLGLLAAGGHTWTWDGTDGNGTRLPDGAYTLALDTSQTDSTGTTLRGYASTSGTVDTVAPALTDVRGGGTFYPVPDGYRDTFAPSVDLGAAGQLALVVTDSRGRLVRVLRADRPAGTTSLTWNGRDSHGTRVGAGDYRWWYTVTDAAGNTGRTPTRSVTVSAQRLVHQVVELRRSGAAASSRLGTARCASTRPSGSRYHHGLLLTNACGADSGDLALATYHFDVPPALAYGSMTVSVYGRSADRPSELSAAVQRDDGGLDIRNYATVARAGARWVRLTSIPLGPHLLRSRRVSITVVLDTRYPGRNSFDLKSVRVRIGVTRLR